MSPFLPVADHGDIVSALPFVVPMILVVAGLVILVARDRLSRRGDDGGGGDSTSSAT